MLFALIRLYSKYGKMIKSKDIAEMIGKDEGTVRNIIASLKAMGFIESKTGPRGGYMPTLKAYEYIRMPVYPHTYEAIRVMKDGKELDIGILGIELLDITNPMGNRAVLKVAGDLSQIKQGDYITLGPTPSNRLVIEGKVLFVDELRKEVVIDINRIVSIPREPVENIASKNLISVPVNAKIKDVAKVLYEHSIRGAPVVDSSGNVVGLITTADIAKAVVENDIDAPVTKYMRRHIVKIQADQDILDAIKIMLDKKIGRLLVVNDDDKPIGIITRTDILKRIAGLEKII